MTRPALALFALIALAGAPALAQQRERTPPPPGEVVTGYLAADDVPYQAFLAPPPPIGSLEDETDVAALRTLQAKASPERWAQAEGDDRFVYPQFEAAFGGPIDRAHTPALVHLLNAALHDASARSSAAKAHYARIRPFQRLQVERYCGRPAAPAPDPDALADKRTAYPSGHTTVGWTAALILAEVAPDRAEAILARGREYALSRVICGHHWPSDTVAARQLASAVVTRLQTVPAFQHDLATARAEHGAAKP